MGIDGTFTNNNLASQMLRLERGIERFLREKEKNEYSHFKYIQSVRIVDHLGLYRCNSFVESQSMDFISMISILSA